jgi:ABC-type branched-subunit amino acid transport system substrate-binding protein
MSQPHDEWFHKIATLRFDMLSETERTAFGEHIQSCASCQEQFNQLRVIDDHLRLYFSLPVLPAEPPLLPPAIRALPHSNHSLPLFQRLYEALIPPKRFIAAFGMQSLIIALTAGLLTFAFGMYVVHVPGISPAIVTPLADIAIAAVILLSLLVMRRSNLVLREEWSIPVPDRRSFTVPSRAILFPSQAEHIDTISSPDEPLPVSVQTPKHVSQEKSWRDRGKLLMISLTLLSVSLASLSISLLNPASVSQTFSSTAQSQKNTSTTASPIGISITGDQVFDINRKSMELKLAAAQYVAQGNFSQASQEWKQALLMDSDDAETLIYLENQQVQSVVHTTPGLFSTYTLVVFTTLSQDHIGGGRDILQGAYVAQKEYNDNIQHQKSGSLLRLMIAVTNKDAASILNVTHQVVDAARHDPSILGVMGLPTSGIALVAYPLLSQAHLPMISPTATSNFLSGVSNYFFRIPPPDAVQGSVGAAYAKNQLHAKTVALFVDESDPYSKSLADSFDNSFSDLQHTVVRLPFQSDQPDSIKVSFKRATQLQKKPDLIYFAGFVNDASVLLPLLPSCSSVGPCLKVMGGDAFYVQRDYSLEAYKNYSRLIFTAFASSDTWKAQGLAQEPLFLKEYAQIFDPTNQYQPGKYGFNRADADAMLSYDAMQAFLHATSQLIAIHATLTSDTVQLALKQIDARHAFQGVSRKIAFSPDGNPLDSQVVILVGEPDSQTSLVAVVSGGK